MLGNCGEEDFSSFDSLTSFDSWCFLSLASLDESWRVFIAGHRKCHDSQMESMVQNEHSGFLLGSAHCSEMTICMDSSSLVNSFLPFSRPAMKPMTKRPSTLRPPQQRKRPRLPPWARTCLPWSQACIGWHTCRHTPYGGTERWLLDVGGCLTTKGSMDLSAIFFYPYFFVKIWWWVKMVMGWWVPLWWRFMQKCQSLAPWVFPFHRSDCQTFLVSTWNWELICVNWHFTILNDWPNLGATPHLPSILTIRRKASVYKGMRMTTSAHATQVPTCIYHIHRCHRHLNHTSPCTSGSTLNSPHRLMCQILSLLLSPVSPVVIMRSMGSLTIGHV